MKKKYLTIAQNLIELEYEIYLQNHHKQIDKDVSDNVIRNASYLIDFETYKSIQMSNYEMKFCKLNKGVL